MQINRNPNNSSKEWLDENFTLVATVLGFIVDLIAIIALLSASRSQAVGLSRDNWVPFLFVIWSTLMIKYISYLRDLWRQLSEENEKFSEFLWYLATSFDHPRVYVFFVVLMVFFHQIINQINSNSAFFLTIIFSGILFFSPRWLIYKRRNDLETRVNDIIENSRIGEEFDDVWEPRIETRLNAKGYVSDIELSKRCNETQSICKKALEKYLRVYEQEKDLEIVPDKYYSHINRATTSYTVLTLRTLAESKPWIEGISNLF